MRRPGHIERRASAAVIARFAVRSSSPRSTSVRSLSGLGITFNHFGHDRQRAPRPRQQLAKIVAGDVFHDFAAALKLSPNPDTACAPRR